MDWHSSSVGVARMTGAKKEIETGGIRLLSVYTMGLMVVAFMLEHSGHRSCVAGWFLWEVWVSGNIQVVQSAERKEKFERMGSCRLSMIYNMLKQRLS